MKNFVFCMLMYYSMMNTNAQNALVVSVKEDSAFSSFFSALDLYIGFIEKEKYPSDGYYIYCDVDQKDPNKLLFFYSTLGGALNILVDESFIGLFEHSNYQCLFGKSFFLLTPNVVLVDMVPLLRTGSLFLPKSSCCIFLNEGEPKLKYYMYTDITNDIDNSFYYLGDTCFYYNPSGYPYDKQRGVKYIFLGR